MADIDGAQWRSSEPNFIYGVRAPYKDLTLFDTVSLMSDQDGVLISKKGILARYSPGQNRIDHNLIPTATRFAGIALGKVNPEDVELWIVNSRRQGSSKWELSGLEVFDPVAGSVVTLKIGLHYSLDVVNPVDFISHFVGYGGRLPSGVSNHDIHQEIFVTDKIRIRETLRKDIEKAGLILQLGDTYLDALAKSLTGWLYDRILKLGLNLRFLDVTHIELDTSRLSPLKRQMLMAKYNVETPSLFVRGDVPQNLEIGMTLPANVDPNHDNFRKLRPSTTSGSPSVIYCAQCSKKHLTTEKFCPYCGNEYHPCPMCHSDNLPAAKRCVHCGITLKKAPPPSQCHKCGSKVTPGQAFCPNCGEAQKTETPDLKTCPRCKASMPFISKFCTKCGYKF